MAVFFFLPLPSSCPIFLQAAQTLWESVDFQFVRECMKINKIRLKFHFLTKIEIKMTYLVFFFLVFYCFFASRAIWKPFYRRLRYLVVAGLISFPISCPLYGCFFFFASSEFLSDFFTGGPNAVGVR